MQKEYIEREAAINVVVNNPYRIASKTGKTIQEIKEIPTADVVPKSEEGAECPTCHGTGRIGTTDWLTKNISKKQLAEEKAKAIAEHEQHIKAEVAREIFKEIEKVFLNNHCESFQNYRDEWVYRFNTNLIAEFAELKKKYTEDKDD